MSHLDVLREVNKRGLSLTVAGADLKLAGPRQRVDADLVGRIRAVKAELMDYLTAARAARQNGFGLTLLQRGYLIGRGDSVEMGNVASHIYLEVDGHWDTGRLESALRMVVARHGMLRTCFTDEGEQVTEPEVDVRIARLDLRGLSEPEQRSRLAELRRVRSHRMLPIDQAPMIAVDVTQLADDLMRLHVSTDGLVVDGISMFMFFIDWHRSYRTGQRPPGEDMAFADYAAALEAARDQPQTRRSREYWLDRLDDLPPRPNLPLRASPASIAKPRFTQLAAKLDPGSWERLKARAAGAGLTPTVVLLAAYAQTLPRWGAGNRFTLTTTIANRPPIHPNIADALGDFSQTMLVEIGIDRQQNFTEHAQALQARMRRDLDHRHFSGIEVLRELARRDSGADPRMPFTFNSTIGYVREDVDGSAVDLFGPEIYTSSQTPQVWLNAFAFEYHGGVVIQVDEVDGLFPDGMIASMVGGYAELLRSLCDKAAWSATTFDLRPAEQRERRTAANDTATEPNDSLVYEAFLALAARTPGAPAVLTTSGSLSYADLAAQATSAAAWLRERGACRDELVGLIMRRGPEQIVGILAAVLAGAAYLPVDARLPAERIRYMLRDGRVRLALSNAGWQAEGSNAGWQAGGIQALDLTRPLDGAAYRAATGSSPDDLAYVLYTSGTTGEPKGVMISHRSVVNVVSDCNNRFGVGSGDRLIGVSAFNFDLSVYDVFGALSAGAAIVLPDPDKAADPAHLLDLCDRFGVTIWNSVPAIASLLAEQAAAAGASGLGSLRLVMMSGDRIPPALPAALWRIKPDLTLMSLGGPTETTIWNISHPIDHANSELEPVPYGRPNANNRAYILDADGLDTPDWVTGEICAAGVGLARGYWADDVRTAERFWFDQARGERLYRTGDLGRYLPDGSIDIAGRSDFQIKVNGYRIENAHQDLPFAKIVAAAHVARDPSRAPLFQIALTYAERDTKPVHAAGVDFVLTDLIAGIKSAKFDLDFTAESRSDGLWIECSYKTALFDAEKMHRLLTHLEVLLGGAADNPSGRISQLPLLTHAELDAELAGWNETAASYPRVCVHEGFEAQVRRTPDAIAVEFGAEQVSYAELDARAHMIARRLRDLGVGAEHLVGVCMGSSILRLAALLGIWKAGGGYVPLDPALPADRVAYMITDTALTVILTDASSAQYVPAASAITLVTIPEEPATPAMALSPRHSTGDVPSPGRSGRIGPTQGNAAYVIYTSGSTGRPKGVVVEHRKAANFLYGMIDAWRVGQADSVLQFASLNFDASVQEMFMPLLAGGRVVLAPPDTLHTPRRLISLLTDRAITFATLTPSVVRLLRDEQFPDLRVLMCGGDEMPSELVATWLRPGLTFVNDYGPTETSVSAVFMALDETTPLPPPIGLPLPNYQAHVLDRHLNPVPPGVTGELHIGGAGVARGYLRRPALTSERFVPDPFQAGGRMYKTGDLCHRRRDGRIVFAGRTDHQVKLRGLRIELGEIETALAAHPGIAQAVVTVTTTSAGEKDLAGYLRPAPGTSPPDATDIRAHLAVSLPGYMIPAHLITVDEFPLNASGKIDRHALPAPSVGPIRPTGPDDTPIASVPATATESVLAGLFADVLRRADVGATDNFFESGGNSLQVMRLIDLIAARTQADLTPVAVFLHPTPRELAAHVDSAAAYAADLIPLTSGSGAAPGSRRSALVLIHPIGGMITDYTALAAELTATSAVHGLQAPGLTSASFTPATLTALVGHYTDLIRTVQPDGPCRLGGWSMGGVLGYEIARRIEQDGGTIDLLVLLDPPYALPAADDLTNALVAGHFVADVTASLGRDQTDVPDPATTSPTAQLRWLAEQLGAGGLSEQLTRRFEVFARHADLLAGYQPAEDGAVSAPTLLVTASRSLNAPSSPCWLEHLRGPADTLVLDSDHYEFLRQPLVSKIAGAIRGAARTEE